MKQTRKKHDAASEGPETSNAHIQARNARGRIKLHACYASLATAGHGGAGGRTKTVSARTRHRFSARHPARTRGPHGWLFSHVTSKSENGVLVARRILCQRPPEPGQGSRTRTWKPDRLYSTGVHPRPVQHHPTALLLNLATSTGAPRPLYALGWVALLSAQLHTRP